MKQIADACNRYSIVSLNYEVVGEEDEDVTLKVVLSRDEELEEEEMKVICPHYPEEKDEYWWVIIGNKKTNRVLTTKRTILKNNAAVQLTFEKLGGQNEYAIYALSDSYIGCDQLEELELKWWCQYI